MHLVDIYKEDAITWENICDCHPHMLPIHMKGKSPKMVKTCSVG